MVNFDNDTTITTSPKNILQILILQERDLILQSLKRYYKRDGNISSIELSEIKANLKILFLDLRASLLRDMDRARFEELNRKVYESSDIQQFEDVFNLINIWLDEKRLTRFDTIDAYDRRRVEQQNKSKNL